jgi:hypothetical protein
VHHLLSLYNSRFNPQPLLIPPDVGIWLLQSPIAWPSHSGLAATFIESPLELQRSLSLSSPIPFGDACAEGNAEIIMAHPLPVEGVRTPADSVLYVSQHNQSRTHRTLLMYCSKGWLDLPGDLPRHCWCRITTNACPLVAANKVVLSAFA